MTQDSARFSRYSGVKSPKSAAVLSEDSEDALKGERVQPGAIDALALEDGDGERGGDATRERRGVDVGRATGEFGRAERFRMLGVPRGSALERSRRACSEFPSVANGVSRAARRHAREGKFVVQRADERGKSLVADVLLMRRFELVREHRDDRASLLSAARRGAAR